MNIEDIFEKLEAYLDGRLPEEERTSLEARLSTDASLREKLDLLRELKAMVAAEEAQARLAAKLEAAAAPHFGARVVSIKRKTALWRWLAVVASAALLVLAGWYYFSGRPLSDGELFAQYFSPPVELSLTRSVVPATGETGIQQETDSLYRLGQYAAALAMMRRLETHFSENPSSGYFLQLGVLYLLDGQPEKALEAFGSVQNGHQNDKAWYTAWAHLKAGNRQTAKAAFDEIARSGSPYRKEAAEVAGRMK